MPLCIRRRVTLLAPLLLLLGALFGAFITERFWDAQDGAAVIICLAFAFGFSLASLRIPHIAARIYGVVLLLTTGLLLGLVGYVLFDA